MEMQTIMVIILIAYSSKCYNFVLLHAAKKNERAVVFVVSIIASKCEQQSQGQAGLCVCVFVLRVCVFLSFHFHYYILQLNRWR